MTAKKVRGELTRGKLRTILPYNILFSYLLWGTAERIGGYSGGLPELTTNQVFPFISPFFLDPWRRN